MKEMLSGGTTLIFVSHNINQVKELCNHAAWIEKGHLIQAGEVNEVCDAYTKSLNIQDNPFLV